MILHRAISSLGPGDTLDGLSKGVSLGYRYIEVDIHKSKDGKFFLYHDKMLPKESETIPPEMLGRRVENLESKDLIYTCVGEKPRECAPLLRDALDLIRTKDIELFLDIKSFSPHRVDEILSELKEQKFLHRVVVQCPDITCTPLVQDLYPGVKIMTRVFNDAEFVEAIKAKPYAIQIDIPLLSSLHVLEAKNAGILIETKTLDTPDDSIQGIKKVLSMGADLIISEVLPQ